MFAISYRTIILPPMKGVIFFSTLILLFALGACTVAEQDGSAVGERLKSGLQGQGTIVPNDPTSDSFGDEYR
jgi:hypothetical protein